MKNVAYYGTLSKVIHLTRLLLIITCYSLVFMYPLISVLGIYIGDSIAYNSHNLHKFFGICLFAVLLVSVLNRFKHGFPYQTTDTKFEIFAKGMFLKIMYLLLFAIVTTGFLANSNPNLVILKAPILFEGSNIKHYFYLMHKTLVLFILPLMLCMHIPMAALRFFDKKRIHARMFRKNPKVKNVNLH